MEVLVCLHFGGKRRKKKTWEEIGEKVHRSAAGKLPKRDRFGRVKFCLLERRKRTELRSSV